MENTVLEQKKIVEEKGVSLWRDAYYRLLKNKLAVFGALFIIFEVILALVTPWIAPYGFEDQNLELTLSMPSMAHWMGTDNLGRDIFTRILYGGRISMMVGFLASMVSVIVGVVYGAVSGYIGGKTDIAIPSRSLFLLRIRGRLINERESGRNSEKMSVTDREPLKEWLSERYRSSSVKEPTLATNRCSSWS
jgi:hypothetical protein